MMHNIANTDNGKQKNNKQRNKRKFIMKNLSPCEFITAISVILFPFVCMWASFVTATSITSNWIAIATLTILFANIFALAAFVIVFIIMRFACKRCGKCSFVHYDIRV